MDKIIELFIIKDNTSLIGHLLKSGGIYYLIDYSQSLKEFRVRIWKETEE